jgi:hypothetical protein
MIHELADLLPNWSVVNRTRCFAHIVNLIAKSLLKQFDVKKKNADKDPEDDELEELAAGLDGEEQHMLEVTGDDDDDDDTNNDDIDGWVDELEDMDEEERKELLRSIRPVSRVLVKVWVKKTAYLNNS